MADRFRGCRLRQGRLPGPPPVLERLLEEACLHAVVGEDFRPCGDDVRELLLQHVRHAGVQLLAPALEQAGVGGLLHQRVLEHIDRLRRQAAAEDQPRADEPIERQGQPGSVQAGRVGQQLMRKLPADRSSDLRHLPGHRAETVEPRQQRGVKCGRDRRGRGWARGEGFARPLRAGLEHGLGQLLEEERHPVRALDDLGHQIVG
jgi:hypothetical protein